MTLLLYQKHSDLIMSLGTYTIRLGSLTRFQTTLVPTEQFSLTLVQHVRIFHKFVTNTEEKLQYVLLISE